MYRFSSQVANCRGQPAATGEKHSSIHTNFCIISLMVNVKAVEFRGSALDDLSALPEGPGVRRDINSTGFSMGASRTTGSTLNTVGQGVREIRIRDAAGAFRVL
jgi:hypothetical protein